jgi:hypothetical protein
MLIRPMIGGWEPPRIERIAALERRHLAALAVPGLEGDLHQDLGRAAMALEIAGSLHGDEARDQFLKDVRERFQVGDPVDFVADIIKESKLERVLIEALEMEESSEIPDGFRYRIVLRELTEPPPPAAPAAGADLGLDLEPDLDLDADLGLDLLDLPAITADIPPIGDLLAPVRQAATELTSTLAEGGTSLVDSLNSLLGDA